MTRQGKLTVIVVAAIQWKFEWIGYYKSQTCKNHSDDPDENKDTSYAFAGQDFTISNVGDSYVAIKTNCAETQGSCDSGLDVQDFDNC